MLPTKIASISKLFILVFFTAYMAISCVEPTVPIQMTIPQMERLLTGDTSKVWIMTKRIVNDTSTLKEPCELDDTLTIIKTATAEGAGNVVFRNGALICTGENDTIFSGSYELYRDDSLGLNFFRIITPANDTLLKELKLLTSTQLEIFSIEKDTLGNEFEVEESYFANKEDQ